MKNVTRKNMNLNFKDMTLGRKYMKKIDIINSKDRQKAGKTLPAHGLYLVKVEY